MPRYAAHNLAYSFVSGHLQQTHSPIQSSLLVLIMTTSVGVVVYLAALYAFRRSILEDLLAIVFRHDVDAVEVLPT